MNLPETQLFNYPKYLINTFMNYETYLLTRLEKQAERIVKEGNNDPQDTITMDIPLFIRMLELAREDIKSDVELHNVVERALSLKNSGTLTMGDYEDIVGKSNKPLPNLHQNTGLDEIRKLAGIKQ